MPATLVGDGPERRALEEQARGLDVAFVGVKRGRDLAEILNAHRVLVVPSRWEEPFGVVALEAMACGCVPIVVKAGGLPEAVGEVGAVFEKEDAHALADLLQTYGRDEEWLAEMRGRCALQIEGNRPGVIASEYLHVLEEAVR